MARGTRFSGVVITLLALAWTTSAMARVQCQGDFQVTNYGLKATPYCEEENIDAAARGTIAFWRMSTASGQIRSVFTAC